MNRKQSFILTTLLITIFSTIFFTKTFCTDLQTFYRTPLFTGEAKKNISDWATHIDARYAEGDANQSWNTQEVKTDLFNGYGPIDMTKLAINLENLNSKPKTNAYAKGEIPKIYDGKVKFKGRFQIKEFDITLQQNIFHGLYLQAYLPIRNLKIDKIDYTTCTTTNSEHTKIADFIEKELDYILEENCIKPLKTEFKDTQLSDPMISIGWNNHCTIENSIVTSIRGFLQGGIIIPSGDREKIDQVFSLPFGYNKHWGINGRGNIHAILWDKIGIGVNAGTTIFMEQTYDQRLTTTPCQNGHWLLLEKGRATADQGTLWDITAYAKAEDFFGGLSVLAAYSYTQQEKTKLTLKDNCILKSAIKDELIKNKNEVINSNKKLDEWYHHAVHLYAQYDFAAHTKSTSLGGIKIQVAYHFPLLGKHSWPVEMFSGTASANFTWNF